MRKNNSPKDSTAASSKSALSLRLGIVFIALWWLPIWLIYPSISALLGLPLESQQSHRVFLFLIAIQTVLGLLGIILTGRSIITLLKKLPRRQVPHALWHLLKTGEAPS